MFEISNITSCFRKFLTVAFLTLGITALVAHDPSHTLRSSAFATGIATITSCAGCHGNPPADGTRDGATGQFVGSHNKHSGSAAGQYVYACSVCHYDYGTSSANYKHQDGFINITGSSLPGNVYSQNDVNHRKPLANTGIVYGTCSKSNFYCHSAGSSLTTAVAPLVVPTWSTSNGLVTCAGCHGNSNATMTGAGSHSKHANLGCQKCHSATTTNGTSIATIANHVNKSVEINIDAASAAAGALYNGNAVAAVTYAKPVGTAFSSCTNIKCHNDGTSIWLATTGTGNTATWGITGGCNACHGNTKAYTVDTWRVAFPLYTSYPISGTRKPNSHQHHADTRLGVANGGATCANCHYDITTNNTTTGGTNGATHSSRASYAVTPSGAAATFVDGDSIGGAAVTVALTYVAGTKPNPATCSNVSCHPTGRVGTKATAIKWSENHDCSACHRPDMQSNTYYHHAMNNYTTLGNYPTAVPQGDSTTGTNAANRKCTMCHVNHDIFSNELNNGNATGRSANLRTNIATVPTKAAGYTNSDFVADGTGGICISCHKNELSKSTVNLKQEKYSNKTVPIVYADFNAATTTHNYTIASAMKGDSSTFNANCTKCHNGRASEPTGVFSSMSTQVHDNANKRNYASMKANLSAGNVDANFCIRCHSDAKATGTPTTTYTTVAGTDYYNTKAMTTKSRNMNAAFNDAAMTNKHQVQFAAYSTHTPSARNETRSFISNHKNVTCADCHNPHGAGNTSMTVATGGTKVAANLTNTLTATSPLRGAFGVSSAITHNKWGAATWGNYTSLVPATMEWQICYKCHSTFNTRINTTDAGGTTTPWAGTPSTWTATDKEFATTNSAGFHPVVGVNASRNTGMALVGGWTDGKTMMCSDCHGNSKGTANDPLGPHASANAFVLKKPWTGAWINGTGDAANIAATLCFDCHDVQAYVSGGTNSTASNFGEAGGGALHGNHNGWGVPCKACHVARPHGWDYAANRYITRTAPTGTPRSMLLIDGGAVPAPYRGTYSGQNYPTAGSCTNNADCFLVILSWATAKNWSTNNCSATPGGDTTTGAGHLF